MVLVPVSLQNLYAPPAPIMHKLDMSLGLINLNAPVHKVEFAVPITALKVDASSAVTEENGKTVKTVTLKCLMPKDGYHDDKFTTYSEGLKI